MPSQSIERALRAALAAHDGQLRKSAEPVPYAVHPLHVALLLARWGVDDDVVVAGLLHDVVEDSAGWSLERVEREFGAHAASIVGQLTEDKSKPWGERKRSAVDGVPHLSPEAATVKAADLLHNLHTLAWELRGAPDLEAVWNRFRGGREGSLSTARELALALSQRVEPRVARALGSALETLEREAGRLSPPGVATRL